MYRRSWTGFDVVSSIYRDLALFGTRQRTLFSPGWERVETSHILASRSVAQLGYPLDSSRSTHPGSRRWISTRFSKPDRRTNGAFLTRPASRRVKRWFELSQAAMPQMPHSPR
jgi:hypothetical protein